MKNRPALAIALMLGSHGITLARAAEPAPASTAKITTAYVASGLNRQEYNNPALDAVIPVASAEGCLNAAGTIADERDTNTHALCMDANGTTVAEVTCSTRSSFFKDARPYYCAFDKPRARGFVAVGPTQ